MFTSITKSITLLNCFDSQFLSISFVNLHRNLLSV